LPRFVEILVVLVGVSPLVTDFPLPAALAIVAVAFAVTATWLWASSGRRRDILLAAVLTAVSLIAVIGALLWPAGASRSLDSGELAAARLVRHELLLSEVALEAAAASANPVTVLPLATEEWALYRQVLAEAMPPSEWERVALYYDLADAINDNPVAFVDHGRRLVRDLRRQLRPALHTLSGYAGA
jgi:hypothetical protein